MLKCHKDIECFTRHHYIYMGYLCVCACGKVVTTFFFGFFTTSTSFLIRTRFFVSVWGEKNMLPSDCNDRKNTPKDPIENKYGRQVVKWFVHCHISLPLNGSLPKFLLCSLPLPSAFSCSFSTFFIGWVHTFSPYFHLTRLFVNLMNYFLTARVFCTVDAPT